MLKGLFNKARRWLSLIFNKSKTLKEITDEKYNEELFKQIDKWKAIYSGFYEDWHSVKVNTINGSKKRRLHTLNMAKVACEELSKIIFTEKVEINISDEDFQSNILETFKKNRFYKVFQGKLEQMFALGGLVLKAHVKEKDDSSGYKLKITYVTPDSFIPLSYENGEVTEGVFLNVTRKQDKVYCLFEFHQWEIIKQDGETKKVYTIKNELYESDNNNTQDAIKVPLETLYEGLEEYVPIEGLTQPMFTYIKPNVANNLDISSPTGISIYANALDTLYAIDTAFDSFIREFRLGKRRIMVPANSVKAVVDPNTGQMHRYFDPDDEVYEAFNFQDTDSQKIQDNTVSLRVKEHIDAINALLNVYAMQIGFSPGSFTFDGNTVKTATEIVSEQSQTYQTKQANEDLIEEGLTKFIHTLGEVAELYDVFEMPEEFDEVETEFYWDDSIIKDKKSDSDFYIKLKNNKLVSGKYALMKILDFTEDQADEMIKEVNDERATMNPDMIDDLGDVE